MVNKPSVVKPLKFYCIYKDTRIVFLARLDEVQEECCTTPGVGVSVGGGVGVSKKFNVKVFYVMGKALSGKLSCLCDRSCFL